MVMVQPVQFNRECNASPIRGSAVATIVASIEPINSAIAHMVKISVRPATGASLGAVLDPRPLEPPADGFPVTDGVPPNEMSSIPPMAMPADSRTVDPARRRFKRECEDLGNKTVM